jgi:hypothetical protein
MTGLGAASGSPGGTELGKHQGKQLSSFQAGGWGELAGAWVTAWSAAWLARALFSRSPDQE